MPRAVVDVNVLVSALLKPDTTPAAVLRAWTAGVFELVVSSHLVAELRAATEKPALARRLDLLHVAALVDALETTGMLVDDPLASSRLVPGDPKDDYVVALAQAAGAHVIVTGDRHLLDVEGLTPPALDPRAFLAWLEAHVSD